MEGKALFSVRGSTGPRGAGAVRSTGRESCGRVALPTGPRASRPSRSSRPLRTQRSGQTGGDAGRFGSFLFHSGFGGAGLFSGRFELGFAFGRGVLFWRRFRGAGVARG